VKTHLVRLRTASFVLAVALLAPAIALAAGAQLSIQQVELRRKGWPHARAYVNVIGNQGSPIPGLSQDLFKVYEGGATSSSKILKVETLEAAQTGASIVIVIQASGAWMGIQEDVKKAVSAFVNGLGEKDQVAVVDYSESAETLAPFSAEHGDTAGKVGKLTANGKSFLLYDGLAQAVGLYASAATPGKGAPSTEGSLLPAAKAIIVISDGRDNGSATDVEKVISDATKRRIPIHGVGHSELDQDSLKNLEDISHRTGGTYKAAATVDDINKSLTTIKDYIYKMYVIEWKTDLDHDGKDHKVEIAMESEGGSNLRSSVVTRTPDYIDWIKIGIIVGAILLVLIIIAVVYVLTRPKPLPPRFCPVCKREQIPEWDVCLFCLKAAKARMSVQKGAQKGKVYPLVGKIVSIGSGPETNIRLMDGAISGKHAGVAIDGDKFEIVDLGSKNGVLVNGKKTPRRFLRNGDVVTLGMTEMKFESSIQTGGDDETDD
jgi:VWFA-related protein